MSYRVGDAYWRAVGWAVLTLGMGFCFLALMLGAYT